MTSCGGCGKTGDDESVVVARRCGRCFGVSYCNVGCQRSHWAKHKARCRPYMASMEFRAHPITAMDNGMFATKGFKAWSEVMSDLALVHFTLKDQAIFPLLDGDAIMILAYKLVQLPEFTVSWLDEHDFGVKRFPSGFTATSFEYCKTFSERAEHVVKMAHQCNKRWVTPWFVLRNIWPALNAYAHMVYDFMGGPFVQYGAALFWYASLLNHSCNPNCVTILQHNRVSVVATRDIAVGEEITISYLSALHIPSIADKHKQTIQDVFSHCLCFHPQCISKSNTKSNTISIPKPKPTSAPASKSNSKPGNKSVDNDAKKETGDKMPSPQDLKPKHKSIDNDTKNETGDKMCSVQDLLQEGTARARSWLMERQQPPKRRTLAGDLLHVEQMEWLIFELMKNGWRKTSERMAMSLDQLHRTLANWLILLIPLARGESKLRLAALGYQLRAVGPKQTATLDQLTAFATHHFTNLYPFPK